MYSHALLICPPTIWATSRLSGTSVWRPQSRYTVSRTECRIKFPQHQRCRAKIALHPSKSRCPTFLWTPLSHALSYDAAGRGPRGGARRAGGGYRGTFGFRKRIALQGGVAATVIPVALLCATKPLGDSVEIARNRRRTRCTENVSKKSDPLKDQNFTFS